jgi:hypothetical protein
VFFAVVSGMAPFYTGKNGKIIKMKTGSIVFIAMRAPTYKDVELTDWHVFCAVTPQAGKMQEKMDFSPPNIPIHIDAGRLIEVIDGLQELSDSETEHLTRCKQCLEAVRLAAREVVRKRREFRLSQAREVSASTGPAIT